MMYWYLFFGAMFLYISYKHQNNVFIMLPSMDDALYTHFSAWLCVTFACKLIVIYWKIWK